MTIRMICGVQAGPDADTQAPVLPQGKPNADRMIVNRK